MSDSNDDRPPSALWARADAHPLGAPGGRALPGHAPPPCGGKVHPDETDMGGAAKAVRSLLVCMGEDPDRPGLQGTPERVARAWFGDWGRGYREGPPTLTFFRDASINYDQMVVERDITFFSHCEHHMAPFFGTAAIAYIPEPEKGILGISKLVRIVDHFSRRLQVQERLTAQIADFLWPQVSLDVAVVLRATHFCMSSRGVRQPNATTITTAIRGRFHDAAPRAEFFRAVGLRGD